MFESLLDYNLTRPVTRGGVWFNIAIIVLGIAWTTVVTIVNVAAVGYELVPFTSTLFMSPEKLWYEKLLPSTPYIPQSRTCDGSIIKLTECTHVPRMLS